LPVLATPADVARWLDLSIPRLRWLAFHSDSTTVSHYVFFTVPKKTGGVRRLSAPHAGMAAAQRKIFQEILPRLRIHDAAHGFVTGRSIRSNATPHVGAHVVVNLDLKDFFPSITFPRIRGLLTAAGYSPCASSILALLCSESPRQVLGLGGQRLFVATGPRALPQGACTSPGLANLAARILDARLAGLVAAWGWTYTRYADDLTFSTQNAQADIGRLLTAVRNIVADEGFTVNEEKTQVQRRSQAQEVTGLVVNQRAKAPRELIRRIRAILHRAEREGLAAQNREGHRDFAAWLGGMIAYIAMTDPATAARYRAQLERVPR
ncbi:MAG: RNA-directed DNA polymerase, partial [Planctomycetes bacterium]|nr:RNA-directed DNA polymerase [Planctomycetota bacterium]